MVPGDDVALVEVRVFGPCTVLVNGEPLLLSGPRQLGVIAHLALHAGRLLSVDAIIDGLWGESPPASATNAIQVYVSQLRRALEKAGAKSVVLNRQRGYLFAVAPDAVDALRVERLAAEGRAALRAGATERATRFLRQALADAAAQPLAGLEHLPFTVPARARLEEVHAGAVEDLFDARLIAGDHDGLVADIERAVAEAPYREHRWGQLMITLYRSGRQADALHAFQRVRRLLADELGVSPSVQLLALENHILMQDASLDAPSGPTTPPVVVAKELPALSHELIGRDELLASVLDFHADPAKSLLVLLGPGGVGKSSLALAAAHSIARQCAGVVAFVDLADVHSAEQILPLVASELLADSDDEPLAAIVAALGSGPSLVVADNVEQIVGAGAELARLAQAIVGTVVVTSRVPLRVRSEHIVRVPPLSLVRQGEDPSPAMLLFAARAAASRHGFVLDATVVSSVADICERLDGLPLALELAAARLRSLPLPVLAARLSTRLDLIADGATDRPVRQQSLRVVLMTTWSLLSPAAAMLAARLSVLDSPWMIEMAELVADLPRASGAIDTDAANVIDIVSQLIDASLLLPPDDAGTYRFLATVREFAAEQLSETQRGEIWDAIATRMLAAHAGPDPSAAEPEPYLLAHVEALLRWSVSSGRHAMAGAVVIRMENAWTHAGMLRQGFAWAHSLAKSVGAPQDSTLRAVAGSFATNLQIDEAVDLLEAALDGELDDARRHRVFVHLAQWAVWQGQAELANRHAAAALEAAQAAKRPSLVARAFDVAAWIASTNGDLELALRLNRDATAAAGEDTTAFDRVRRLQDMVDALISLGHHEEALVVAERTYEATTELGPAGHSVLPDALTYLGAALVGVGRPTEALGPLRESVRQATAMERRLNVVETLVVLAAALAEVGAATDAMEIWGATDAFHVSNGTSDKGYSTWPLVRAAKQRIMAEASVSEIARGQIGATLGWRAEAEKYVGEAATSG